jgi:DNA-binding SARP family transcriptional activator/cytochrome c-type biogenesis protein CcmH/NrfG
LGGFALEMPNGGPLVLSTRKDRLLLAYLAVSAGKPQQRSRLAGLLWADRSEAQARESLRQSLASLRQVFRSTGTEPLHADRDTVALDPTDLDIDVLEFEELVRTRNPAGLELYRGELLEGFDSPNSEYDAWLRSERLRLEELAIGMLEKLVASELSSSTKDLILQVGWRLLDRDPLRESVYRALMRALQAQGKRAEALKLYKRCRDVLKAELGITPDLETEQLYRDVLTDRSSKPASLPSGQSSDSRSSLAVMPFDNLSSDSALNPLCEGLAEDVITGLGRFRLLSVIDRHSSSVIAKRTADTAEISRQLGVKFIVQGSLLRLPDSLRVTVRLVDASTRIQCWGETYSIPGSEVPTLPDKVVGAIVATLHSRLESSLTEQVRHKPSWDAYECVLQGIKHIRGYAPDDNLRAVQLFQRAVELDPNYALARAYRAFADVVLHNYTAAPPEILAKSKTMAQEAVELDPYNPRCQWLLGLILAWCGDLAGEERAYRRALELNPGDANVMATYGVLLAAKGRAEEGVALIREAMKLNPYHPDWYWFDLGSALYVIRRYADAVEAFLYRSNPGPWVLARLAASYAQLGLLDDAARTVREVLKVEPNFSIAMHRLESWTVGDLAHFAEGMRKAGLPD